MFSNNTAKGFSNLVSTSNPSLSIFDSNIVKRYINTYLQFLKTNKNIKINLYVPETLSGCLNTLCKSVYGKYIQITGDTNWIGLMIYQHRTRCECPFTKDYKCTGTTESGKERETEEGKKYSSSAWDNSYTNGNHEINKALAHRFRIHNVGKHGGTYTIFEDLSVTKISSPELGNFLKNNNLVYISERVKYSDECHKYSTDCKHKHMLEPRSLTIRTQKKSPYDLNTAQSQVGQETEEEREEDNTNYESNV
jgi:hypothetical protein